jgi:hypothetical protein
MNGEKDSSVLPQQRNSPAHTLELEADEKRHTAFEALEEAQVAAE